MILPVLAPILATLAANGLGIVADAVTKKGKEFVEEKLGIELTPDLSDHDIEQLKLAVKEHERELLAMAYGDIANARNMQVEAPRQEDVFSKRFNFLKTLAFGNKYYGPRRQNTCDTT